MASGKPFFELGAVHTRWEIQRLLGGSGGEYLPNVDGRVVCACITRQFNPDAPAIILAGSGPKQIRAAHLFCDQKEPVPVFIKVKPNRWEYVGDFAVEHASDDPSEIAIAEERAGWRGVSLVMHLKEA
ncbi:MAG TPA: hypothetical protein VFW40_08595 [Capsulimonadaceae bacterium]|nr:hypothetical protein [Capsulimonadaceae bacterium]